jgi:hypothetical protein
VLAPFTGAVTFAVAQYGLNLSITLSESNAEHNSAQPLSVKVFNASESVEIAISRRCFGSYTVFSKGFSSRTLAMSSRSPSMLNEATSPVMALQDCLDRSLQFSFTAVIVAVMRGHNISRKGLSLLLPLP